MRKALLATSALLWLTGTAQADVGKDLRVAARAGDLGEVRRLVEGGAAVDAGDTYGTTALALAARGKHVEVVWYLLEKGADPSAREEFFGVSVLGFALWDGEPEYEVAKVVLAAGAEDRAEAVAAGLESGNLDLARAAASSGPVLESEAERLREDFAGLEGEAREILAALETRADPPPPEYTAEELATFAGPYRTADQEASLVVEVVDGGLSVVLEGAATTLAPFAERAFRSADGSVTLRYSGRAGTIERVSLERPGTEDLMLGPSDLQELVMPAAAHLAGAPVVEPTVHWPGFRGANRTGVGDGAATPIDWNLETGDGVAWRSDLPGLGNSSPVVWGDRVFVTTAVADGGSVPLKTGLTGAGDEVEEEVEHRWLALAFDKATGEKLWETEVGRGVPLTRRHFKATQANSSPVTDGEHLVVVFPTAGLACLGMDGTIHWQRELGGLNAGGFNDPGLQWGFAASPILHDGQVILQADIHDGPYLAAWDVETGDELWRTERPDVAPSWATPAIWSTPAGDELVTNASIIRGYDPESGAELWSLSPTSVQVVASPVVAGDRLYVSSGYPPARPIYAVEPGIRGHHEIVAGKDDPALAWHQERGGAYMPTPLVYRGLLYIVHHDGRLVAHDPATGGPVYRARFSAGGTFTNSPVAANGRIYQGTEEGTLYVFAAGPEYEELAVHELGAPLMATPAISEGLLIVRTPAELIALGGAEPTSDPRRQGER